MADAARVFRPWQPIPGACRQLATIGCGEIIDLCLSRDSQGASKHTNFGGLGDADM